MNGLVFCYLESQLQNPGHNGQTWLGFPFLLLPSGWACNLKHHLLRSCSPALLLSCSPFSKHLVLASQPLKLSTAATSPALLLSCSPALLSLNIWYSPLNLSNSQLLPPLLLSSHTLTSSPLPSSLDDDRMLKVAEQPLTLTSSPPPLPTASTTISSPPLPPSPTSS